MPVLPFSILDEAVLLENFMALIEESKALNSKVFSLIRLELLSNLATFEKDGISYRELKATLNVTDGNLFTNLKVLQEMGYIKLLKEVKIEGKKLDAYIITKEGLEEWIKTKNWLRKFVECEPNGNK
jgi:DNA-binding MarR family transcriptional regulator